MTESSSNSIFPCSPLSTNSNSSHFQQKRMKKQSTHQADISIFLQIEEERLALLKEDTKKHAENPD